MEFPPDLDSFVEQGSIGPISYTVGYWFGESLLMASHVKFVAVVLFAGVCLSGSAFAEEAERTPDATQKGVSNDKGPTKYGVKDEPKGETAPVPAPAPVAPAPAKPATASLPVVDAPAGGRLVILDGNPVYVDEKFQVIGRASGGKVGNGVTADPVDPNKEAKRKETAALAAKIELENSIHSAIRRLGTSGWREARAELIVFGKDAVPFLIEAMTNVDEEGKALQANYQLAGHSKADTGRATRNRTRGEICSELLTEIITAHTSYKGDLPTLDQQDWQTWWVANGDKISFGK